MKKLLIVILSVLMIAVAAGCSKQATTPTDQPVTTPADTQAQPGSQTGAPKPEEIAAAAKELQSKIGDIYFAFDKYDLDDSAKGTLRKLSDLMGRKNVKVLIEGNCDERGTKEYNLALGEKRANSAKTYLVSLGIASSRIDTVSYGKEKPVCSDSTEACWAKNRRGHFILPEAGQ